MSELTKEKIYKKELIAGGATGNNNLERIRSLAGGGGNKYLFNKEYSSIGTSAFYISAYGILGNNLIRVSGCNVNGNYQNTIEKIYNLDDSSRISVQQIGSMDNYATNGVGFVYGGLMYVVGGQTTNHQANQNYCCIDFYDGNIYAGECVMPEVCNGKAVVIGKFVYIFGGTLISSQARTKIIMLQMVEDENLGYAYPQFIRETQEVAEFGNCAVENIGDNCYVFATGTDKIYRVNLFDGIQIGDVYELDEKMPTIVQNGYSAKIGSNIYFVAQIESGKSGLYKFNALNEKIETLWDGKDEKVDYKSVIYPAVVSIGNKVYIISGNMGNGNAYRYIQELIQE